MKKEDYKRQLLEIVAALADKCTVKQLKFLIAQYA